MILDLVRVLSHTLHLESGYTSLYCVCDDLDVGTKSTVSRNFVLPNPWIE